MDIEFTVKTGTRTVDEKGAVTWDGLNSDRGMVTFSVDSKGAIDEAVAQFKRILKNQIGKK